MEGRRLSIEGLRAVSTEGLLGLSMEGLLAGDVGGLRGKCEDEDEGPARGEAYARDDDRVRTGLIARGVVGDAGGFPSGR